jgi:hypothetical protein
VSRAGEGAEAMAVLPFSSPGPASSTSSAELPVWAMAPRVAHAGALLALEAARVPAPLFGEFPRGEDRTEHAAPG